MSRELVGLFTRCWWRYDPGERSWFAACYHGFNLFEGAAWWAFAVLVAVRYFKYRRSKWEWVYCFAFISFGASDFREAQRLDTWLIAAKLVNLVELLILRSYLIKRY